MIPDEALRPRLRRGLLERGRVLATLLAEVLAGKPAHARLTAMGVAGKPGMRPEEKLRYALDRVEARRALLDARDPRYGRCEVCAAELTIAELEQMPWADRCRAHAGVARTGDA
jgi:hypothetical protein